MSQEKTIIRRHFINGLSAEYGTFLVSKRPVLVRPTVALALDFPSVSRNPWLAMLWQAPHGKIIEVV